MRLGRLCSLLGLALGGLFASATAAQAADVTVDGARRYQTVEGFGTCLIAWEGRFRDLYRTEAFQKVYSEGVGLTMLRVNMWGPTFERPTEDWTKIRHQDFDLGADGGRAQVFIDFGQALRKHNPDAKVIGTVWSPPAWMKVNRSITDRKSGAIRAGGYGANTNRVDPKYFKHFCKWVVEYVKLHDKLGVPFHAVSPGNEVQFTQTFESCVWDGQDFAAIVVQLREMLDAEGYKHVKIFGPETMTSHLYEGGTGSYVKAILKSPKALEAIGIFATHGYEDGVKAETSAGSARRFRDLVKDTGKPFWITEGGTGGHDWPAPIQKGGIATGLHNALVGGNCSAFVPWQITERTKSVHALMVMSKYTPKTYAAMHYTKFVRPGARRIDAGDGFDTVRVGAFVHEGKGDVTVVAINPTDKEQPLNLEFPKPDRPVHSEGVSDLRQGEPEGGRRTGSKGREGLAYYVASEHRHPLGKGHQVAPRGPKGIPPMACGLIFFPPRGGGQLEDRSVHPPRAAECNHPQAGQIAPPVHSR